MTKRILHLTLKKKWFDLIAIGKKKIEYRAYKPHWHKRIGQVSWFDEIHFRNGYSKTSPFMRVKFKGRTLDWFENDLCYALHLGKILEIKNYNGATKNENKINN